MHTIQRAPGAIWPPKAVWFSAVETMTCEQLNDYLICQGIHSDVTTILTDNRIGDGELFVAMCDDDLKEIVPVLGDRMRLGKILNRMEKEVSKGQL